MVRRVRIYLDYITPQPRAWRCLVGRTAVSNSLSHDHNIRQQLVQQTTAIAATNIAETTTTEDKLSEKPTFLEEIELRLFNGFEDTTALEDKKSFFRYSGRLLYFVHKSSNTYVRLPLY